MHCARVTRVTRAQCVHADSRVAAEESKWRTHGLCRSISEFLTKQKKRNQWPVSCSRDGLSRATSRLAPAEIRPLLSARGDLRAFGNSSAWVSSPFRRSKIGVLDFCHHRLSERPLRSTALSAIVDAASFRGPRHLRAWISLSSPALFLTLSLFFFLLHDVFFIYVHCTGLIAVLFNFLVANLFLFLSVQLDRLLLSAIRVCLLARLALFLSLFLIICPTQRPTFFPRLLVFWKSLSPLRRPFTSSFSKFSCIMNRFRFSLSLFLCVLIFFNFHVPFLLHILPWRLWTNRPPVSCVTFSRDRTISISSCCRTGRSASV